MSQNEIAISVKGLKNHTSRVFFTGIKHGQENQ
jgi:hypothetical protein